MSYDGPPFRWEPERRFLLRCDLEAALFHLYHLDRGDVGYIMDTFPDVVRDDEQAYDEYRTKRVILEIYDDMTRAQQTGRSTATTIAVNAGVSGMLAQQVAPVEAKALLFTDNRQDASLQAGHLNDLVQTAQIRAGLVAAMQAKGPLPVEDIGYAIFDALALEPADYLAEPGTRGPGLTRGRKAITGVLQYRALEDLSRGWRIVKPNLEQTGLLSISYDGLKELTHDDSFWNGVPRFEAATPETRVRVLTDFLNYLRMQLAIEAPILKRDGIERSGNKQLQYSGNLEPLKKPTGCRNRR